MFVQFGIGHTKNPKNQNKTKTQKQNKNKKTHTKKKKNKKKKTKKRREKLWAIECYNEVGIFYSNNLHCLCSYIFYTPISDMVESLLC